MLNESAKFDQTAELFLILLFLQVVSADLFNPSDCHYIALSTLAKCQHVEFIH